MISYNQGNKKVGDVSPNVYSTSPDTGWVKMNNSAKTSAAGGGSLYRCMGDILMIKLGFNITQSCSQGDALAVFPSPINGLYDCDALIPLYTNGTRIMRVNIKGNGIYFNSYAYKANENTTIGTGVFVRANLVLNLEH